MAKNNEAKEEVVKVTEAKVAEPKVYVPQEKMVTAKSKVSGKFYVAGWIQLEKDKEIQVSVDQKRVLQEADLIYL